MEKKCYYIFKDTTMSKIDEKFSNGSYLYHYTSIESTCKILEKRFLLFGELKKMNDVNESYRSICYKPEFFSLEDKTNQILDEYKQISLTQNGENMGFNIPAMWGHYANNGYGACLVFDKKKLLENLHNSSLYKEKYGPIKYLPDYNSDIYLDQKDVEKFFIDHIDKLFFEKSSDWSYEQEYRIVKREGTFLPLGDSLKYIIVHSTGGQSAFGAFRLNPLKEVCRDYANQVKIIEVGKFLGEELNLRDKNWDAIWSSKDWNSWKPDIGNR